MIPRAAPSTEQLIALADRVRQRVIRCSEGEGCFLGASLSCVDLLVSLYADCIRLSPERLDSPDRDFVLLSKGHAVPALYSTLIELGFLSPEQLTHVYWHPNRSVPGVEFHSGSLGHLLSVGIGMALDARLRGAESRVFVVVGDGELDEGSIWEGVLVAQAQQLGRLTVVVDRNRYQANLQTEELVPLEPLPDKFEAFGWNAQVVNGHSFDALRSVFTRPADRRPTVVIANTVRGKGLPEHQGKVDKWFVKANADEVARWTAAARAAAMNQGQSPSSSTEGVS